MIPGPHRMKGGALQLGAEDPGQPGPFGTWTGQPGPFGTWPGQETEAPESDAES